MSFKYLFFIIVSLNSKNKLKQNFKTPFQNQVSQRQYSYVYSNHMCR